MMTWKIVCAFFAGSWFTVFIMCALAVAKRADQPTPPPVREP